MAGRQEKAGRADVSSSELRGEEVQSAVSAADGPVRTSVVLLTHNCGHRLDPVLDQLEALRVPLIAVDNGSGDDTVEVLRRRPSIEIIPLATNIGAAARNLGVERARTPYVAMCDDDGWYESDGLAIAADLLDQYPALAVVNGSILIGSDAHLDPISAEMAQSPLPDPEGLPGAPLLGFMAGAVIVRRDAYLTVGGYDARFFIGGEEETLSFRLAKAGWRLQYVPEVVVHHHPSLASVTTLRAFGLRNTLWNAWLHRRAANAVRWTVFTLADRPKNRDWLRGAGMAIRGLPWVLRERAPMSPQLDDAVAVLDRRRYAERRPVWTRRDWEPPAENRHALGQPVSPQTVSGQPTPGEVERWHRDGRQSQADIPGSGGYPDAERQHEATPARRRR